jgi:hypothetical protein
MSATTKVVGLIAGLSAVAAIGVAVAQAFRQPLHRQPCARRGQQSSHMTSMGETGVPAYRSDPHPLCIVRQQEVPSHRPGHREPARRTGGCQQVETAPAPRWVPHGTRTARLRVARADRN